MVINLLYTKLLLLQIDINEKHTATKLEYWKHKDFKLKIDLLSLDN